MSTDLESRIAELARVWDASAGAVTIDELAAGSSIADLQDEHATVIELDHPERRRGRMVWTVGTAAAIAIGLVALVVTRDHDPVDPVEPGPEVSLVGALPTTPATAPVTAAPVTAAPVITVPVTIAAATTTTPPVDIPASLAEIDTNRAAALRSFESLGFTVHHARTRTDGTVQSDTTATVVLRNDGSAAVSSADFIWSYYDAVNGTARAAFVGSDGQPGYQEIVGQADSSVALGVPTGLPNGIVEPFPLRSDGVVAVADDTNDGRPTWPIDSSYDSGDGGAAMTMSLWIDTATGVTLQTRSEGMNSDQDGPLIDTVTLSDLMVGAALPADFPGTFPDGAAVSRSGDVSGFAPTSLDAAVALFGHGVAVPALPADVVSVSTTNFGNPDGGTTASPSLIVRWFDGFLRTEYRLTGFPPTMALPDTCGSCTGTVLDELRAWNGQDDSVNVNRGGLGISITGPDRQAIQAVLDSLVESP
ncbi:MAG: hypothetical protein JWN99_214 [Ilumatobacteraceae bacterium]|nr:hypothetical protein [Ilumatobacteraceae bacterium]